MFRLHIGPRPRQPVPRGARCVLFAPLSALKRDPSGWLQPRGSNTATATSTIQASGEAIKTPFELHLTDGMGENAPGVLVEVRKVRKASRRNA